MAVHLKLPVRRGDVIHQQAQLLHTVQHALQFGQDAGAAVDGHIALRHGPGLPDGQGAALFLNGDDAAPVGEQAPILIQQAVLVQKGIVVLCLILAAA